MRSKQIIENLIECVTDRHDRIYQINTQVKFKGGWEVWFQVEWYLYFTERYGYLEVEREKYYRGNNGDRCDLVLTGRGDPIWCELKTMSPHRSFRELVGLFWGDVDKLGAIAPRGIRIAAQVLLGVKALRDIVDISNELQGAESTVLCCGYMDEDNRGRPRNFKFLEYKEIVKSSGEDGRFESKPYEGEGRMGPIFIVYWVS